DYLSNFTAWRPYEHRVLASVDGQLVPIPINLDTVNRLYGLSLTSFQLEEFFRSVAERPENTALYRQYQALADSTRNVHFVGRLATYKYYNMDQVVAQALAEFERIAGRRDRANGHTLATTRIELK